MLTGKFWIIPTTPDGTKFEVVNASTTEHALIAKKAMLQTEDEVLDKRLFSAMSKADYKKYLDAGIEKELLDFLREGGDPRKWVMQHLGWIRTAAGIMNAWTFDQNVLLAIRKSKFFSDWQPKAEEWDMVSFEELSTGEMFDVQVKKLIRPSADAEAIKHLALRGRNPQK